MRDNSKPYNRYHEYVKKEKKEKITISIDRDIVVKIDGFINDNEDYLNRLTCDSREGGRSAFINLVLKAILIPDFMLDEIMAIDESGYMDI